MPNEPLMTDEDLYPEIWDSIVETDANPGDTIVLVIPEGVSVEQFDRVKAQVVADMESGNY